jgi:pilus assembly protein FimV
MSRGQNPLVLMMALSLPGAAHALGLGEIHVNSALNEPLAADIDILGATAEELSSLTASIANKDTFLRFGAERPAFLASATFKVSHDVKGRPVLVIRSTESFTEPVVNLLVDLRWHNGEVIRQYSLLLDPTGFPAATQVAAVVRSPVVALPTLVPAAPAPAPAFEATNTLAAAATPAASADATASPAARTTRTTTHVKIGAKATLRGVAWRVGARSDSDLKKTMLAIFRANPNAFEGNINRLRLGAVLTIPSAADISTISKEDAGREVQAQMTAWRASPQKARTGAAPVQAMPAPVQGITAPAAALVATTASAAAAAADAPRTAIKTGGDAAEAAALNLRVQSLERGLHDMQDQLERQHNKLLGVQAQVRYAEEAVSAPVAAAPAVRRSLVPSLIGGLALLAGALGAMFLKLRRRAKPKTSATSTLAVGARMVDETPKPVTTHVVAPDTKHVVAPATKLVAEEQVSNELSAANPVRDAREAKVFEQVSAAVNIAMAAPPKPVFTVDEDELQAAYEDTQDLSGETAILAAGIAAASGDTANLPTAATVNLNAQALQSAAAAAADESATIIISAEARNVDTTKLDYNFLDLDQTAQHVQMPSVLHERAIVKERRSNLVDVLKRAVEREPERRDLRMKLLETYYAAAATNRQGFLEVAQKLARDRDRLGEGEWDKIAFMGKQIASDTALFSSDSDAEDDNELADCA